MKRFVLMLEGDGDDRYITQEAISGSQIDVTIKFSSTSIEFFNFLSEHEKPALILIDYNSVPENGVKVLKQVKSNPNYNDIPVVIVSDTNLPKYKNECYRNGASSFIKKPDSDEATNNKIASFFHYWFDVVEV